MAARMYYPQISMSSGQPILECVRIVENGVTQSFELTGSKRLSVALGIGDRELSAGTLVHISALRQPWLGRKHHAFIGVKTDGVSYVLWLRPEQLRDEFAEEKKPVLVGKGSADNEGVTGPHGWTVH